MGEPGEIAQKIHQLQNDVYRLGNAVYSMINMIDQFPWDDHHEFNMTLINKVNELCHDIEISIGNVFVGDLAVTHEYLHDMMICAVELMCCTIETQKADRRRAIRPLISKQTWEKMLADIYNEDSTQNADNFKQHINQTFGLIDGESSSEMLQQQKLNELLEKMYISLIKHTDIILKQINEFMILKTTTANNECREWNERKQKYKNIFKNLYSHCATVDSIKTHSSCALL